MFFHRIYDKYQQSSYTETCDTPSQYIGQFSHGTIKKNCQKKIYAIILKHVVVCITYKAKSLIFWELGLISACQAFGRFCAYFYRLKLSLIYSAINLFVFKLKLLRGFQNLLKY